MKNSKIKLLILIVIVAAAAGMIIYPNLVKRADGEIPELSPAVLLEQALSHKQPTVVAFSYDAECCPGNEEFFAAYKEDVYRAVEPFSEKVQLVWINAGVESKLWQDEITTIARQYSITHLPSLLVLSDTGEEIEVFVGLIEDEQLHLILESEVE